MLPERLPRLLHEVRRRPNLQNLKARDVLPPQVDDSHPVSPRRGVVVILGLAVSATLVDGGRALAGSLQWSQWTIPEVNQKTSARADAFVAAGFQAMSRLA